MDWEKMKAEYMAGGISYRQLSQKYGVPLRTIAARAKKANWQQDRQRVYNEAATNVANSIIESKSEADLTVYEVGLELLEMTRDSMRATADGRFISPNAAMQYASAIRSIKAVLDRPSEMDLEEQRARIEKLRQETARASDSEKNEPVQVVFSGEDVEEWSE